MSSEGGCTQADPALLSNLLSLADPIWNVLPTPPKGTGRVLPSYFLLFFIHNSGKPLVIPMTARDSDTVSAAIVPMRVMQESDQLSQLFAAHYGRVLAAAYRIAGNMADAEDVAQSLFLRFSRGEIPQVDNLEGYLYRSAVNCALDLVRRRKVSESLDSAAGLQCEGSGASPEAETWDRELSGLLRQAIGELTPRSAEMFALRYLEDLDNRQIAELMGTSQTTVAVILYQARLKLRKRLAGSMRGMR